MNDCFNEDVADVLSRRLTAKRAQLFNYYYIYIIFYVAVGVGEVAQSHVFFKGVMTFVT